MHFYFIFLFNGDLSDDLDFLSSILSLKGTLRF